MAYLFDRQTITIISRTGSDPDNVIIGACTSYGSGELAKMSLDGTKHFRVKIGLEIF